jgi:fatty acid desaturase
LPVLAAFHTSVQHAVIRAHPTRACRLNELPFAFRRAAVFRYQRDEALHLQHHRGAHTTDPDEDSESYFWPRDQMRGMNNFPPLVFVLNNTLVGRLTVRPFLVIAGLLRRAAARVRVHEITRFPRCADVARRFALSV